MFKTVSEFDEKFKHQRHVNLKLRTIEEMESFDSVTVL